MSPNISEYVYLNIGTGGQVVSTANEYIYLTVGVNPTPAEGSFEYAFLNIGTNTNIVSAANEYAYLEITHRERFVGWGTKR